MTSMVSRPLFSHGSSVPRAALKGVPTLKASSPFSAPQEMIPTTESVQDVSRTVSGLTQSLNPPGPAAAHVSLSNNLHQARQVMNSAAIAGSTSIGLQSMGGTPMAIHMSNMISSGMSSSVPPTQTVLSSGQPGMRSVPRSGTLAGNAQNSNPSSFASTTYNLSGNSNLGMPQPIINFQGEVSMGQSLAGVSQGLKLSTQMVRNGITMNQNMMRGVGQSGISSTTDTRVRSPGMINKAAANMPLSQQTSSAIKSAQSKYVKVWEGNLLAQRRGEPVLITRLEGYRKASASKT